jgi:hypothetical protein
MPDSSLTWLLLVCPLLPFVVSVAQAMYKQCGQSWSNDQLGTAAGVTICRAGCAMSSVAMVQQTKGANMNPGTLNKWLRSNGGYVSGDLIVWGATDKLGKARMRSVDSLRTRQP